MAAAEALTGAHKCRELARVILVRLKELVSPNDGTNMERLAAPWCLEKMGPNSTPRDYGPIEGRAERATVARTAQEMTALTAFRGFYRPLFSFHQCSYRAPDSIASFLSGSKTTNPRLITLVEEEMEPSSDGGFVGRFMDSLHHYSAVYDSLEAGFPMRSGSDISGAGLLGAPVSRVVGPDLPASGDEEGCSWGQWLGAVGFRPVNISFANHCQAKLLLGLYNDGYRVEELTSNKLVLGWKSRRLLSASIWTSQDSDL
ncbi:hypothetical protein DH2020_007103 [Rehmannia glutinosa]|uniref:DELLA protein n=1 Tax=Rehmannia glutinosa TaxID=99300 RepID=A0ABR0TX03_REHGL